MPCRMSVATHLRMRCRSWLSNVSNHPCTIRTTTDSLKNKLNEPHFRNKMNSIKNGLPYLHFLNTKDKEQKGDKESCSWTSCKFQLRIYPLNLNPPCDVTIRFFDVSGTTGAYINLKRMFTQLKTYEYI